VIIGAPLWFRLAGLPSIVGVPAWQIATVIIVLRYGTEWTQKITSDRERRNDVVRRKRVTARALDDLAAGCRNADRFSLFVIEQGILQAVVLHAMRQLAIKTAGTVTANLLVVDGPEYFNVVARYGDTARSFPQRYHRSELFCTRALDERKTVSVGDVRFWYPKARATEYRDILAIPVLGVGGKPPDFGVVTVDSTAQYIFSGKQEMLSVGLSPYIELLKLCLVLGADGGPNAN
jgi:hypothetical protein